MRPIPHQPTTSTLFPYTTLFRSPPEDSSPAAWRRACWKRDPRRDLPDSFANRHVSGRFAKLRSEEHTSELQSHHDLVCRLLLEKKKKLSIDSTYVCS